MWKDLLVNYTPSCGKQRINAKVTNCSKNDHGFSKMLLFWILIKFISNSSSYSPINSRIWPIVKCGRTIDLLLARAVCHQTALPQWKPLSQFISYRYSVMSMCRVRRKFHELRRISSRSMSLDWRKLIEGGRWTLVLLWLEEGGEGYMYFYYWLFVILCFSSAAEQPLLKYWSTICRLYSVSMSSSLRALHYLFNIASCFWHIA